MKEISTTMTVRSLAKLAGCSSIKVMETPKGNSRVVKGYTADGKAKTLAFLTKNAPTENVDTFEVWEYEGKDGIMLNGCGPANNGKVLAEITL